MSNARHGTRIDCEIPLTLASLDTAHAFSETGTAILVNLQGCAARFDRPLEIGRAIRLDGLPAKGTVTARVVNCFWPGDFAKFWIVGLVLDEPGDVWGIETPEDWSIDIPTVEVEKGTSPVGSLTLCLEDDFLGLVRDVVKRYSS